MSIPIPQEILELSVSERIQLVEDIWDTIASNQERVALSETQKEVLDRRIEAYHAAPDAGIPWKQVQGKLKNATSDGYGSADDQQGQDGTK